MALRRTRATASTVFLNYLRTPSAAVLTTRRHFTTAEPSPDSNPPIRVEGAPQKFKMENPFQSAGPSNVLEVNDLKNGGGALVRVALPGVGANKFKVWAVENTVFFTGEGEKEYEDDESGRLYGGSLEFQPELHKAGGVKAEMKNGVLCMTIPQADKP